MSAVVLRCSLGDLDVSKGMLRMFERGNWVARLGIGNEAAPVVGETCSILFARESGAVDTFVGTVRASVLLEGTVELSVTVVGGKGKLNAPEIVARYHTSGITNVHAGLVAKSIATAAGETLAAGVDTALGSYQLRAWARAKGTATGALDVLASVLGLGWRMLADGTIWIGAETWPEVTAIDGYVSGDPGDGMVLYQTDGAPLRPGTSIDGRRATEVCYYFDAEDPQPVRRWLRAEVRVAQAGSPTYPAPLDPYRSTWAGTVLAQDVAGGVLQIACDSATMGNDLRDIPLRMGGPGLLATIPEGTRIRVRFENADPRFAFAETEDQDPDATKPLALKDDEVSCGYLSALGVAPMAPIVFVLAPPGTDPPPPNSIHLIGKITGDGHAYIKGVPA